MGTFVDIAASVLSQSERRVEIAGQNIANMATSGYKRRVAFAGLLGGSAAAAADTVPDLSPAKLTMTGRPLDLAIAGAGFFAVNANGRTLYTRQGEFQRDADGRLVTGQGFPVQAVGGGDIVLKSGDVKVLEDGAVLDAGEAVAKLALVDIRDPQSAAYGEAGLFSVLQDGAEPLDTVAVRQGALETSNVSLGDEMVSMMEALRRAETGQKLVGVYDDLMGRVLTAFGQGSS